MAVVWGLFTSLFIGLGDLVYARISSRMAVVTLMITSSLGGVATGLVALAVIDSEISVHAVVIGAAAGAAMGSALAFYIRAMAVTTISVTSPITAVLAALCPVVWEVVVDDEVPSGLVLVGASIALLSLSLTTWSPESKGSLGVGIRWALSAGTCYGAGNILLGQADDSAGVWPAIAHRATGAVMFATIALVLGLPRLPPIRTRRWAVLGGVFGTLALVAFLLGVETGQLGVLSVAASLFPAVSVSLLVLFAGHPARWWQGLGVLGAIAGVALIAVS